jgi:SAM-dependent methyltransferase
MEREIKKYTRNNNAIRILDMGCGKGKFLAFISNILPILHPEVKFEFYGYDIQEHGAQSEDYLTTLIEYLNSEAPSENWEKRIEVISSEDNLPYDEGFFNYIVSNQVFEHVMNHEFVLGEIHRCLKPNGISINLFPVKEVLYEGHLRLPLAHRILNEDLLKSYIKVLNFIGFGRFSEYKSEGMSIEDYAKSRADYISKCTNYKSYKYFLLLGKKYGFRTSFRYTQEFYKSKLFSLLKVAPKYKYKIKRSALLDKAASSLLKYINNVTLVLEKQ